MLFRDKRRPHLTPMWMMPEGALQTMTNWAETEAMIQT
jgi:hypothetical protein